MIAPRKAAAWVPALLYMGLIFTISSMSLRSVHLPRSSDKGIHFAEYAVLGLLIFVAARRTLAAARVAPWLAWALASLYGVSDELHQSFVPGRNASIWDWAADTLGAATAVLVAGRLLRSRTDRQTKGSA